jgi:hypothetical protein
MAKSGRFSTTALVITTMAVLITTLALVIWLPTPGELASRRAFDKLSQVRIGPVHWSGVTLPEAVADVNAQLEKKGETHLRLFVSDAFVVQMPTPISMQLEEVPVTECARYLCDLSMAGMSGSREGITFESVSCWAPSQALPWRVRVRNWVSYNLWERWRATHPIPIPAPVDPFAPTSGTSAAPGFSPAPPSGGENPFGAPTGAP